MECVGVAAYRLPMASPRLVIGRQHQPGAYYVITTVVADRRPRLASPRAADMVVAQFRLAEQEGLLNSLAWVVMPDHLHWMFQLHSPGLGACMQRFKSRSARQINALQVARGAVWQAGYYDHRLRHDEDLLAQARYLLANPGRKGLADAIGDYPHAWSTWGTYLA